tara:strand:+ start:569 stop:979 length:411 start_codon:yes stop_codon:yes gene_type:complete
MSEDEYKGQERRKCDKDGISSLATSYRGIKQQLTVMNGRVARNEGDVKGLDDRVRDIETNELLEEGFRKGQRSMKISTRNMIIMIVAILGCLATGIKVFTSQQHRLETMINKVQPSDVKVEVEQLRKDIQLFLSKQ